MQGKRGVRACVRERGRGDEDAMIPGASLHLVGDNKRET